MTDTLTQWNTYLAEELPKVRALLATEGITLSDNQPHLKGERFLMQALTTTSGKKLILLGQTKEHVHVVIKATKDPMGIEELTHERRCRTALHSLTFSYEIFHSPRELLFKKVAGYTFFVSEFIPQSVSFLDRPLPEQFSFALRALKAQEHTRATTASHLLVASRIFGRRTSQDYLEMFTAFSHVIQKQSIVDNTLLLQTVRELLTEKRHVIEQYGGFLTHTDFVPHNFRIKDNTLYLLDFSSLSFGNKHESWARFLNFMTLYNHELEHLLLTYVQENRAEEERQSLHLMRLFRLSELIAYYSNTLPRCTGNLLRLNQARVRFWSDVLEAESKGVRVARDIVTAYQATRDALRSEDEKMRQSGLH